MEEKQTTTLGMLEIERQLKILPNEWYPSMLRTIVEQALKRRVFVDGGATDFVEKIEKDTCQGEAILRIRYSRDRKLYYVTRDGGELARDWLTVEKFPGPVPEECKNAGGLKGWIEYDGGAYYREVYPFNCFSVKSEQEDEPLARDSELWKDYAASQKWRP